MKYTLSPSGYNFNASSKTITFTGTVPAAIGNIMHVANITKGVLYFQPQAGPDFTGTYAGGVLTLTASTTGHSNTDQLLIIYDDGSPTVTTNPNVTRGAGSVDANTQRITVADNGPLMTALGNPADAAATSDSGTFGIIPFLKRGLGNWATLLARVPALVNGASPVLTTASPTDPTGNGTRAYDLNGNLRQSFSSTSTAAIAIPTLGTSRELMLHTSQRCFIRFGDSSVIAAAITSGHLVMEAGERWHIRIPAGVTHFRVIRDSSVDGNLNVTAVL